MTSWARGKTTFTKRSSLNRPNATTVSHRSNCEKIRFESGIGRNFSEQNLKNIIFLSLIMNHFLPPFSNSLLLGTSLFYLVLFLSLPPLHPLSPSDRYFVGLLAWAATKSWLVRIALDCMSWKKVFKVFSRIWSGFLFNHVTDVYRKPFTFAKLCLAFWESMTTVLYLLFWAGMSCINISIQSVVV